MPLILVVLFIVVPLVELAVILQVGDLVGVWWTIAILLSVSVAGSLLIRREGTRTWAAFRQALASGRVPTSEVVDGALVLVGGALLLTPGFVTDVVGLSLVFPPTRALWNRLIRSRSRSLLFLGVFGGGAARDPRGRPGRGAGLPSQDAGRVEVIDVDRDGRRP